MRGEDGTSRKNAKPGRQIDTLDSHGYEAAVNTLLTRRDFVAAAIGTAGSLALGGCRTRSAAAPDGGLPIIDTHTHFYDPARPQGVPWPPREDKLLFRTVLPSLYRSVPTPEPVTGTVVVEASPWVEDNQWILDLASRDPFIVGFVGNLPLGTKQCAGHLKRFAANRLFSGVRARGVNLGAAVTNDAFISDLKLLASSNRSLDLVGGLDILSAAVLFAKAVPDLRIVLDHLAGVRVDGKAPPSDWLAAMREASQHRNVFAKVSGLVEGTGRTDGTAPADAEFYRPTLDAMWSMFGADRLIYGSNWPVSERFAPLGRVQQIVSDYFGAKGPKAKAKVFAENARMAYRWVSRKR